MRIRIVAAAVFTGLILVGCGGTTQDGIGPTNPQSGNNAPASAPAGAGAFVALFRPSSGVLPFPTDLYFSGSTDGTLNLPASIAAVTPHFAALNALDGYSTVAPATARFSAAVNPASISGATVRMIEVNVDNATKATVGVRRVLVYGTDYTARVQPTVDSGGATLEIIPLRPLTPSSGATNVGYLVVLTNGLTGAGGGAATPDADYLAIKAALPTCAALTGTLNLICQLTGAHLQIAGAVGVPAASVVLTFSFSTQATQDTLNIASALAQPTPIVVQATGLNLSALNPALPPVADVYVGTLTIPYYHDPAAPLTGSWRGAPFTLVAGAATTTHLSRFNPVPVVQATLTIPLFVTVPNAAGYPLGKPAAGWPVVIFQHGLRGNRTQSAAIAATYAVQGFAVAAIDIPLHGITDTASPLYQGPNERTFNLDLVNNATGAPPADGVIDGSGTHIINLTSLLTSRDNLRQAEIDIVQLARSLPGLDLDGNAGTTDVDGTRLHFAGISLGGIVGTAANALPSALQSAYLNVPGGGIANLLRESAALSPSVNAGLAANGLVPGLTLYENFFRNSQTAIDSGDPLNWVATTFAARPSLLTQVNNDTVVPNLATQRLVNAAPWVKANAAGPNGVAAGSGRWVQFNAGSHGSLLDPTASLAVTTEMQTHAASFVASGGAAFLIANPALLDP
ncbi:MAG TPA: hypothetical protein VFR29_04070 [Steroidobacteraceae bacterium]|nr:hypothetical protein [Steroidobacteraceae bacterium]